MVIRTSSEDADIHIVEETKDALERICLDLASKKRLDFIIKDEYMLHQFLDCTQRISGTISGNCPLSFDSWSCFNASSAHSIMTELCPTSPLMKCSPDQQALQYCDKNGSWWVHPLTNLYWSNYTNCVDYRELSFNSSLSSISVFYLGFGFHSVFF